MSFSFPKVFFDQSHAQPFSIYSPSPRSSAPSYLDSTALRLKKCDALRQVTRVHIPTYPRLRHIEREHIPWEYQGI